MDWFFIIWYYLLSNAKFQTKILAKCYIVFKKLGILYEKHWWAPITMKFDIFAEILHMLSTY